MMSLNEIRIGEWARPADAEGEGDHHHQKMDRAARAQIAGVPLGAKLDLNRFKPAHRAVIFAPNGKLRGGVATLASERVCTPVSRELWIAACTKACIVPSGMLAVCRIRSRDQTGPV